MHAFLEKLTALIIRWVFALLDSSEGARHLEKHAEFPYGESFTRARYSWIISVMITVDSLCSTPKITTSNIHSISVRSNLCQVIKLMIRFREKKQSVSRHTSILGGILWYLSCE